VSTPVFASSLLTIVAKRQSAAISAWLLLWNESRHLGAAASVAGDTPGFVPQQQRQHGSIQPPRLPQVAQGSALDPRPNTAGLGT
jgi:hypothetical protein